MKRFLRRFVKFQSTKPILFWACIIGLIAGGFVIVSDMHIDAFPDFTNVQVQIITQYPGKASEEIERQISIPLETATNGLPGLTNQRSISLFGLSVITLTFDDNVQAKQARLDISQRVDAVDLPEGVRANLSPDTTPIGEIFRYTVEGPLPVDELRLIQDWTLEREFKSIAGVADVVSFGGPIRTIDVLPDADRIRALGLTVSDIAAGLAASHANAGGSFISQGQENFVVRSIGLYRNPQSWESAVIATQHNTPVRIADIGEIAIGHTPRQGQVGRNRNDDTVEGIILMRPNGDSAAICHAIEDHITRLNESILPKGVKISTVYRRTDLIDRCMHTVTHNVVFGILLVLVILALAFGLEFWPLILAVALVIPFALLTALAGLRLLGYNPNLISLGAVDFGIIVETAIFGAEAAILAFKNRHQSDNRPITDAIADVLLPSFLCALILIIAFIPILSLQRVAGKIFRPLAVTLVCAVIGGQLGALIFIPSFSQFVKPKGHAVPFGEKVVEWLVEKAERLSKSITRINRWVLLACVVGSIGLTGWGLGQEFLPQLNEGSIYVRAYAPQTISSETAISLAATIRDRIRTIPEVRDVISQVGRPDDGTDINGFDVAEFPVFLKSPDEWKSAKTIDGFMALIQSKVADIDGVKFSYSQPIKDNVDEAISGVKGDLVLKVFGPNVIELQKIANQAAKIIATVPGATEVVADQTQGQAELRFTMNRDLLDRYGIRVKDAEDVLETGLLGKHATKMVDDQGRAIDVMIKPANDGPASITSLQNLPVIAPSGVRVSLAEVADVALVEGVSKIFREQGERRIAIKCGVKNRPVVGFVTEAKTKLNAELKLPPHYHMEWSGSFQNAQQASSRLMTVVPICLGIIVLILQAWFGEWATVGYLMWELPFAWLGGIVMLRIMGLNLSISAAAGGIVLIGVSFLTGMMLLSEWVKHRDPWKSLHRRGPGIVVSNLVAIVGLIPAAFSHGMGSETAKPFAVMILGGLLSSLILSLTVLPAVLDQHRKKPNPIKDI